MVKIFHGLQFPDHETDRVARWLVRDGLPVYQDEQITRAIEECGARKGLAIDGGAHVGLWALRLARHFREVRAFEPQPDNFACLEYNTRGIANVKILPIALDEMAGKSLLIGHGAKTIGWSLEPTTRHRYNAATWVQTIAIDDLNLSSVDLIKLDIEGGEYAALLGARKTLLRCRPVVVIEEKLDCTERASRYLEDLGMWCIFEAKPDRVYIWES